MITVKTKYPSELCMVTITDEFFLPLAIDMEGRHRCQVFLRLWTRFASEIPACPWFEIPMPRILNIIAPCKPRDALAASRIITSIITWFGTNVGHCFAEKLFVGIDRSETHWQSCANVDLALSLWAKENSLYAARMLQRRRLLEILLRPKDDERPLSIFDLDVAERFITYLTTASDGHRLLWKLEQASKSLQTKERERIRQLYP